MAKEDPLSKIADRLDDLTEEQLWFYRDVCLEMVHLVDDKLSIEEDMSDKPDFPFMHCKMCGGRVAIIASHKDSLDLKCRKCGVNISLKGEAFGNLRDDTSERDKFTDSQGERFFVKGDP